MPRPSRRNEQRATFLPIIARAFVELGYVRATTQELARRCEVRENVLYRLWPDKKSMFIAAIDFVFDLSARTWRSLLDAPGPGNDRARRLLDYEAAHHGEFGHYRIVFAGLSETNDPDIRAALRRMYQKFFRLIRRELGDSPVLREDGIDAELAAWAIIGLATASNVVRELELLSGSRRAALLREVGRVVLGATRPAAVQA